MSETQAVYYRELSGVEPVDVFLDGLSAKAAAKVDGAIEEHLNGRPPAAPPAEFPATSQVDGELRELRVRFANTRYRVLYQRSGNLFVLLHAIEKNSGKLPPGAISLARERMADFTERMNADPRVGSRAAGHDAPGTGRHPR